MVVSAFDLIARNGRDSGRSVVPGGPTGPGGPFLKGPKKGIFYIFCHFLEILGFFGKIGFLGCLIAPGVLGPLESYSGLKNTPGDLSTASDRGIFIDFRMLDLCFVINAILTL